MSVDMTRVVGRWACVTGGRAFDDAAWLGRVLAAAEPVVVIQGGQRERRPGGGLRGADYHAAAWAWAAGVPLVTVMAHWRALGKRAGPERNGRMLRLFAPQLVIAFPGGRGTADCCKQARSLGIPVYKAEEIAT